MVMNRKGEPMSLGAVITIIILVVLLVFVILALSGSFGNLGDYNPFGGKRNIDAVVLGCNTACDGGKSFEDSWCYKQRKVVFEDKSDPFKLTCEQLANPGDFSVNIPVVGLRPCDNIQCNVAGIPAARVPGSS